MTDASIPSCPMVDGVDKMESVSNAETAASEAAHVHPAKREPWNLSVISYENKAGCIEARKVGLSTHMSLWPGAVHLLQWFEAEHIQHGLFESLDGKEIDVLELGAGCGWLGMTLAANVPQARVHMTDLGLAIPELNDKVAKFGRGLQNITVEECDWGQVRDDMLSGRELQRRHHDFIIGSELAWNMSAAETLPYAFKALATPGHTRIFYGHNPKYSPKAHARFLELCEALKMTLVEVIRHGKPVPAEDRISEVGEPASNSDSEDDGAAHFAMIFADEKDNYANAPKFTIYEVFVHVESP